MSLHLPFPINRTVCWFSCGAASAVACKLALAKYEEPLDIVYQDTGSEHPDSRRFLHDCEEWFGRKIIIIRSPDFTDIWNVFKTTNYLVGVGGARCTGELKRRVAERYINHFQDREVFGYTVEEKARVERFKEHNTDRIIECPLIERGFTKTDCFEHLKAADINLPAMYRLGFDNNNCIGCVKGQKGYWNKIRQHFPEIYNRMAKEERRLDVAINKRYENGERIRVFLDEMEDDGDRKEGDMSCGIICDFRKQPSEHADKDRE